MTELHPEIKNVLDRIINRSEDTRKKYLKSIDDMENSNEINRNTISCSNMAHVAASTPKSDQLNILMKRNRFIILCFTMMSVLNQYLLIH